MADGLKTEYYVRFESRKHGSGIFEVPCRSIHEAAGQFAEDADAASAMKLVVNAQGRMVSAEDVTDAVIEKLRDLIEDGTFSTCPHPLVEDVFDRWREEADREAEEQREHEAIERAMLQI